MPGERKEPFPQHLAPMLATPGGLPKEDNGWGFEYKWDGIRAIGYCREGAWRLESRNLLDITHFYPELQDLGRAWQPHALILDGEIVALDAEGRPSFHRLQQRMHLANLLRLQKTVKKVPVFYFIFDLLHCDGRNLMSESYQVRRTALHALAIQHPSCRIPPFYTGPGSSLLAAARQYRLEGIMAKRLDSHYLAGQRSSAWLKIKLTRRQEFVVCGWVPEKNASRRIGSLLLGYYDPEGRLQYAGRVGTGFDRETQRMLLEELEQARSNALTVAVPGPKENVIPLKPVLVAEVEYGRWPAGALVQQASFKGLRWDKPAQEVVLEPKRE